MASYGELSECLQQRIELVTGIFLALGEPNEVLFDDGLWKKVPPVALEEQDASADESIFWMGRG